MMEKYYNDEEEVAVLYSPGFGAGWSSWNDETAILFDKDLVQLLIKDDIEGLIKLTSEKYPNVYHGGAKNLKIYWLEKGSVFEIEEYDGSESVHIIGGRAYNVA